MSTVLESALPHDGEQSPRQPELPSRTRYAGAKSGGSEIAHARAPLATKCSNSLPIAARSDAASRTSVSRDVLQPLAHFGFAEVKHQVIGAQAGDVSLGVEAFERIVEVVGEEDGVELRPCEDLLFPIGLRHFLRCGVVELFPIRRRQVLAPGEIEKRCASSRNQLYWIVLRSGSMRATSRRTFSLGSSPGSSICSRGMPAEWAQLGVIVIAQDVGQRFRRGRLRLDVRMRIDQPDGIELGEQSTTKLFGHVWRFRISD